MRLSPRKIMDYTVTSLEPTASTNISREGWKTCVSTFKVLSHARSCDKGLPKERIINKSWRKTIPDNRLAPTFYKLSLGRCPYQHSLSVAETWAFSIGITCFIDMHRSVCTTSNRNQVAFCRCIRFWKQSFLSRHARMSVCTSRKRFL